MQVKATIPGKEPHTVARTAGKTIRKTAASDPTPKPAGRIRRKPEAAAEVPAPKPRARRTKPAVADDTPKPTTRAKKAATTAVDDVASSGANSGTMLTFLTELKALTDRYINAINNGSISDTSDSDDDGPAVADDTATDTPQTRDEREAELSDWSVKDLQDALIATEEFDAREIRRTKDVDTLVSNLLDFEFGDDADDDQDDDDSDSDDDADDVDADDTDDDDDDDDDVDDDDDEDIDTEALMKRSLAELKKIAVQQYGLDAGELKGLDKDAIIAAIVGDDDDDDDDVDDDSDGDDGEDFYTEEELEAMTPKQLKAICDENGITYGRTTGKAVMIKRIMEA